MKQTSALRPCIPELHNDAPSRYLSDPREELMRFENFERYSQQSTDTRDGNAAPLPPRPRLSIVSKD